MRRYVRGLTAVAKSRSKRPAKKAGPKKTGRPPAYHPDVHPVLAKVLARAGKTNAEIAGYIGINESTLYRWQDHHEEFKEALKEGKAFIDDQVEDSLLRRAMGYSYTETHKEIRQNGKGESVKIAKEITRQVPPDVLAAIFWLKNRRPFDWRDKRNLELTGQNDGPLEVEITIVPPLERPKRISGPEEAENRTQR